jgi:hypothetical protein
MLSHREHMWEISGLTPPPDVLLAIEKRDREKVEYAQLVKEARLENAIIRKAERKFKSELQGPLITHELLSNRKKKAIEEIRTIRRNILFDKIRAKGSDYRPHASPPHNILYLYKCCETIAGGY